MLWLNSLFGVLRLTFIIMLFVLFSWVSDCFCLLLMDCVWFCYYLCLGVLRQLFVFCLLLVLDLRCWYFCLIYFGF